MLDHRVTKNSEGKRVTITKVTWIGEDFTWIRIDALRLQCPFIIIDYVVNHKNHTIKKHPDFAWTKQYLDSTEEYGKMTKAFTTNLHQNTPKFKFGVEVPQGTKHALKLDRQNRNTLWTDAIKLELKLINEYQTFRHPNKGESLCDYQLIPYHFVFDVKVDGRRQAHLVAGGNVTTSLKEEVYSRVVRIETIRLAFLVSAMNGLQTCACDISSAFLYS